MRTRFTAISFAAALTAACALTGCAAGSARFPRAAVPAPRPAPAAIRDGDSVVAVPPEVSPGQSERR